MAASVAYPPCSCKHRDERGPRREKWNPCGGGARKIVVVCCQCSIPALQEKARKQKECPCRKESRKLPAGADTDFSCVYYITDCLQAEVRAGCPAQGQLPAILPGAGPLRKALFPFCGIPQDNQRIVPGVVLCGIVQAAKFLMFLR